MQRINAFDGKRQTNTSKAFPERQPASPKAWSSSSVGCLLVGGGHPAIESARALFPDRQGGSGSDPFRDSSARQQRRHGDGQAYPYLRPVRQGNIVFVYSVEPPINTGFRRKDWT